MVLRLTSLLDLLMYIRLIIFVRNDDDEESGDNDNDNVYVTCAGCYDAMMKVVVVVTGGILIVVMMAMMTVSATVYMRLTKEQTLTDFADIFRGLGKMEGKLHLEVNESVPPVMMMIMMMVSLSTLFTEICHFLLIILGIQR